MATAAGAPAAATVIATALSENNHRASVQAGIGERRLVTDRAARNESFYGNF